jgi:hypothetical protein
MRSDLVYLTSDKLKGRRSMEPGSDSAGRFIAAEFRKAGLSPIGSSYFQEYAVAEFEMPGKARLHIHSEGKAYDCGFSLDFAVPGVGGVRAPLVFAGFGITEPGYDDYAGLDARGKVVMLFDPEPAGFAKGLARGLREKALNAQRHGAVGVVAVGKRDQPPAPPSPAKFKPRQQMLDPDELRIPAVRMMDGDAVNMLAATGRKADELAKSIASFPMPLFEVGIQRGGEPKKRGRSFNVVGMIEGSDATLRNETVLVCAHYDHLGAHEGKIFRGANDNGSGTAAVLELVRLFTRSGVQPRRSIVFACFGSEEQGLLGSRYYAMNPLRALAGTVAVNLDMIASPERPNEIDLVGASLSPALRQTVLAQNRAVGLKISEESDNTLVFRSDHFPFLLAGAPAVQAFAGSGPDYHQPSDTVGRLDFDKLIKVTRLAQLVMQELAGADALPRLKAGDSGL